MSRVKLVRVNDMVRQVHKEIEQTKKKAQGILKAATLAAVQAMMANTPVWEGATLRNYGVAIGRRGRRGEVGPVGGKASNKRSVRENNPGKTNTMALGAEPRRGPNYAAVMADIQKALSSMKGIENITIFNSAEGWEEIENANWPGGKGQRIRNKAVVSILGAQKAQDILRSAK